ncbi:MAG: YeiH family putative sulfate export transporter [Rhodospirillales bacterium]|nr:YeiH family putative sulfate export transporter [Rhodospirillales bacterium]
MSHTILPKIDGPFLKGMGLVVMLAAVASALAALPALKAMHIHGLIIAMVLGMVYANTLRARVPESWVSGVDYAARRILRLAIVLYGFRLTFQDIGAIGLSGVVISALMVALTFLIGYIVGVKVLKLDKEISILCSAGAAICGAAAVLATEAVIKAKPYKSMVAVGTVVIFGTLAMFLYPAAYRAGLVPMSLDEMGVYIGASVHEVAHVVAASAAVDPATSDAAVIVKMVRVMMLAPFLIVLGLWFWRGAENIAQKEEEGRKPALIPWFAVYFIGVAGFNSLNLLPASVVGSLISFDTFLLTMAMGALGMETTIDKFKGVGLKPIYLSLILFIWLIFGGFFITKGVMSVF